MAPTTFQFDRLARFLRQVVPELRQRILPVHAAELAAHISTEVKIRYRHQATPLGGLGLSVAAKGKERGIISGRPAKRPMPDLNPLFYRLASAVRTTRIAPGAYRTAIDPTAVYPQPTLKYPSGVPLGFLAWVHENRRGSVMPVTRLMLSYTTMLREGRGGFGTRRRTAASRRNRIRSNPVYGQIVVYPPDRPVWSYVIAQRIPVLLQRAAKRIEKDVMALAMQYGGKPVSALSG